MKALFTYNYGKENMDLIKNLGYEIIEKKEKELVYSEDIADVEVLVCYNPFTTLDIRKMEKLKWIQLSSVGVDQVPVDAILENHIILTNNKGGYSIPMGEFVVLKTLEIYKKSALFYEQQKNKKWKISTKLLELYGKNITFIGTGSIAVESAKRFQGFEANIIGVNTKGRATNYFDKCYPISKIDEVLAMSDVVILTIPYTEQTHHLINAERLNKMKKDAVLINVSRGSIINEKDLIEHLEKGNLRGAALDVFEEEPLPPTSPLWDMENVIVTPHNSWMSEMRDERRFRMILENMKRYKNNQELINVVDLKKGY